jgi:hypothetical protein
MLRFGIVIRSSDPETEGRDQHGRQTKEFEAIMGIGIMGLAYGTITMVDAIANDVSTLLAGDPHSCAC